MNKSHLTAIARKAPSTPARYLSNHGFVRGRVLDYGSGRGCDARTYGWDQYDPHFQPDPPTGDYDTILCTYVLNTIPDPPTREAIQRSIWHRLRVGGSAYITVRGDVPPQGRYSKRGTYQQLIELPWKIIKKTKNYTIYQMTKTA